MPSKPSLHADVGERKFSVWVLERRGLFAARNNASLDKLLLQLSLPRSYWMLKDAVLVRRRRMERTKGCAGGCTGDYSTLHAQNFSITTAERSGLSVTTCSGSRGL